VSEAAATTATAHTRRRRGWRGSQPAPLLGEAGVRGCIARALQAALRGACGRARAAAPNGTVDISLGAPLARAKHA
jgi:hypothetical protein